MQLNICLLASVVGFFPWQLLENFKVEEQTLNLLILQFSFQLQTTDTVVLSQDEKIWFKGLFCYHNHLAL